MNCQETTIVGIVEEEAETHQFRDGEGDFVTLRLTTRKKREESMELLVIIFGEYGKLIAERARKGTGLAIFGSTAAVGERYTPMIATQVWLVDEVDGCAVGDK